MVKSKKEIIIFSILIIIQTIIYISIGANKSYMHMDESYSLGLANYDKVEIQDNEDFYDTWHTGEYYEDYLAVQDKDIGHYNQVYENQKNDVHPPLYYLLLRIFMGFSINSFSMWPGIILNIIIYAFITLFMYLITQNIFKRREMAMIISFISSIIMASLSTVIYIRMYALSTLNILITTYLHMKLLDKKETDKKLLTLIGISALAGSLTHYYYLFYLVIIYLIFMIQYTKEKRFKELIYYTITMAIAGGISLIIFPYSIKHMFFGYRGQGAISNLTNISNFFKSIKEYLKKVNYYCFNNMIKMILLIILGGLVYKIFNKNNTKLEKNKYIKIILFPTIFYFIIVSIASPWIELRYIMPICGCIFVLVMYITHKVLGYILNEKERNIIIGIILITILIMPIVLKMEPEVLYIDNKVIVKQLSEELNIPALYLFSSESNRFLDDIYLFSILKESYIAKDIDCTPEKIKQIFNGKDIQNGIIVFINIGQDNDKLLEIIKESLNLSECVYLKRMNECDIYCVK